MTATELYDVDPDLRTLLDLWLDDRRAPLVLADYLRDRDMWAQGDCARWCHETPDRQVFSPLYNFGERGGACGPFPGLFSDFVTAKLVWRFRKMANGTLGPNAHDVPPWGTSAKTDSPVRSILALLDGWTGDPSAAL